jgi:hypothetical protein
MNTKQTYYQLALITLFAVLWGVGLFGVFELDFWACKIAILSVIAPLSLGLEKIFYGV